MSIDRDFEQVSEEHMKSMTKPEGPAQEPGSHDRGCPIWVGGKCRCTTCVPATPAPPSQPAGAREWLNEHRDDYVTRITGSGLATRAEYDWPALLEEYARQQTAAKDAALEAAERERDSLRAENAALKAGKDGQQ